MCEFIYNEIPYGYQYIIDAHVKYYELTRGQDTVYYDTKFELTKVFNENYPKEYSGEDFIVTVCDQTIIDGVINDIHRRGNPDVLKRKLESIYYVTTVISHELFLCLHDYGNSGISEEYNSDVLNNVVNGYGLFTTYITDTTETASFKRRTHYFMEVQYAQYGFDHVK